MREIKFRGLSENGWISGDLQIVKDQINGMNIIKKGFYISNKKGVPFAYKIDPQTVGQFTGLHDKNGKEIFEGDVYKCRKYSGTPGKFDRFIGRIYYLSGKFTVRGINKYTGCDAELYQNGEVIGNIHEEQFKHLRNEASTK